MSGIYKLDAETSPSATGIVDSATGVRVDPAAAEKGGVSYTVGDGTNTVLTVSHTLDTHDVSVYVYDLLNSYAQVYPDIQNTAYGQVTLTFASAPATNQYRVVLRPTSSLLFNVMDYGAVGNGIADDQPAIQAALDACAGTGGVVLFPAGKTFLLVSFFHSVCCLQVGSNTHVRATGATIKRGVGKYMLCNWASTSTPVYTGNSNIIIEGGTWDGNATQDWGGDTFSLAHGQNITVRDATFKDTMRLHAIDVGGVKNLRIDNCIFEGHWYSTSLDAVWSREAIQLDYVGSGTGHSGPADLTTEENVVVSNCRSRTSSTTPPAGYGGGPPAVFAGQHSMAQQPGLHQNIYFINNIVEDCMVAGFRIMGMNNATVTGNIVRRSGTKIAQGISFTNGVWVQYYGNGDDALPTLHSTNIKVFNNKFGGAGIGSTYVGGSDVAAVTVNVDNKAE